LQQVLNVFSYLKRYSKSMLVMDNTKLQFDEGRFHACDWSEFYPDAKELFPADIPEPRGKRITMTCYVDADHTGCRETRRSHTGVIIFMNRAPILCFKEKDYC